MGGTVTQKDLEGASRHPDLGNPDAFRFAQLQYTRLMEPLMYTSPGPDSHTLAVDVLFRIAMDPSVDVKGRIDAASAILATQPVPGSQIPSLANVQVVTKEPK